MYMFLDFIRRGLSLGHGAAFISVFLVMVAAVGCGRDEQSPAAPLPIQTQVPDFSLADVNPNSASSGQAVSPRQQLSRISAWYFGHAT